MAIRSRGLSLNVLVLHAPVDGDPAAEDWWESTRQVAKRLRCDAPSVGLVDANARLGSELSEAVGGVHPETENSNGAMFHELLVEMGWAACNTFACDGPGHTWISSQGHEHRIDYICVPVGLLQDVSGCRVDRSVDVATVRDDHFPLRAELRLGGPPPPPAPRWRAPCCERALLAPGPQADRFVQCLAALPAIDPASDVDAHHRLLVHWIRQAASVCFPVQKRKPRASWLSAQSWQLMEAGREWRQARLAAARALRDFRQPCAALALAAAGHVAAARHLAPCSRTLHAALTSLEPAVWWTGLRGAQQGHAWASDGLRECIRQKCASVRVDRRLRVNKALLEMQAAARSGRMAEFYKKLRGLRPWQARRPPMVRLLDGELAATPAEAAARWREHYAAMFSGRGTGFGDLELQRDLRLRGREYRVLPELEPSLQQVLDVMNRMPRGKAVGVDGIPSELLRLGGLPAAAKIRDLVVSSRRWRRAPIARKGGAMFSIPKPGSAAEDCDSQRPIMINDQLAGLNARLLRPAVLAVEPCLVPRSQAVGSARRGAVPSAHCSWALFELARARGQAAAALFADLKSAYYSIVRQFVIGFSGHDDVLRAIMHRLDLPPAVCQELVRFLAVQGSLLRTGGASQDLIDILTDLNEDTWLVVEGDARPLETERGSRAGEALADLVFVFLHSRVMGEVRGAIEDSEYVGVFFFDPTGILDVSEGGRTERVGEQECSYADDSMHGWMDPCPRRVLAAVRFAAVAFDWAAGRHGLTLSFAAGKTEAVLAIRGRGSQAMREELREAGFLVQAGAHQLRLVQSYKHLGTLVTATACPAQESARRCRLATGAYRQTSGRFLSSRRFGLPVKRQAVGVVVEAVQLYACELWPEPSAASLRAHEAVHMRWLRKATAHFRGDAAGRLSDLEVRRLYGESSVESRMRMRRLLYLPQLLRASPWLKAMLQGPGHPWTERVRRDLAALRVACAPKLDELPDPLEACDPYVLLAAAHPRQWRTLVGRLAECATRAPPESELVECPECGKQVKQRGLGTHMYRAHSLRRRARLFVEADGRCPACNGHFHTRLRGIDHMEHRSRACFAWCVGREPLLAPERVVELDALDAAQRLRAAKAGVSFLSLRA